MVELTTIACMGATRNVLLASRTGKSPHGCGRTTCFKTRVPNFLSTSSDHEVRRGSYWEWFSRSRVRPCVLWVCSGASRLAFRESTPNGARPKERPRKCNHPGSTVRKKPRRNRTNDDEESQALHGPRLSGTKLRWAHRNAKRDGVSYRVGVQWALTGVRMSTESQWLKEVDCTFVNMASSMRWRLDDVPDATETTDHTQRS